MHAHKDVIDAAAQAALKTIAIEGKVDPVSMSEVIDALWERYLSTATQSNQVSFLGSHVVGLLIMLTCRRLKVLAPALPDECDFLGDFLSDISATLKEIEDQEEIVWQKKTMKK